MLYHDNKMFSVFHYLGTQSVMKLRKELENVNSDCSHVCENIISITVKDQDLF
jgi:hypothetical protein